MIEKVTAIKCTCERCGHIWIASKVPEDPDNLKPDEIPKVCPKCKNPYWNVPFSKKKNK